MATIPTTHDEMFEELRGAVPLQYLRALGWMESGLNPKNKTGSHWGLFQAGPENLTDYNAAKKTSYTRDHLLDPRINTQVFLWELARIMRSLASGGLAVDWGDDEYVKLLTMAWNAGWSAKGGVRRVLDFLKTKGLPFTHEVVKLQAANAGAASTLSSEKKAGWQKGVAALYRHLERAPRDPIGASALDKLLALAKQAGKATAPSGSAPAPSLAPAADWLWLALLVAVVVLTHRETKGG
jgi:hypothetical protein